MRIAELGQAVRKARTERGLTQAQLAASAGISRETLNLLENGLVRDLGVRKVLALFEQLGVHLTVNHAEQPRRPDYLRMACTTANVSFKSALTEDELVRALLTGKVPSQRSAHIRTLLDDAPVTLLQGLADEARKWTTPAKLERNLARLAHDVKASRRIDRWLKTG